MASNDSDLRKGSSAPAERRKTRPDAGGAAVGDALRTVYEQAVNESVPDEMMDLLNKLG